MPTYLNKPVEPFDPCVVLLQSVHDVASPFTLPLCSNHDLQTDTETLIRGLTTGLGLKGVPRVA